MRLCECSCGQEVKSRFVQGHQMRVNSVSKNPDVAKKISLWHKGQKLSEEHKRKVSQALTGVIPWNKGLTKDIDTRVANYGGKVSKALKGRIRPIEEARKAAESNRGKKRSEEARRNISIGHLGQLGWNTGLKDCYSEETLRKMALAKKGTSFHKGYHHSEKTKKEHSLRMKKLWADRKSIFNSPDFLKNRAKAQIILPNKPELLLIDLFEKNKLPFKYVGDGSFIIERKNPDFVNIDGKKQVIELYGEYWHSIENAQERIDLFSRYGFSTLVIWENELQKPENILIRLKEFASESTT